MKKVGTAPGGTCPGVLPKPGWPARRDLKDMLKLCSAAAFGIHKPVKPYAFQAAASRLEARIGDVFRAWSDRQDTPDAAGLYADYQDLRQQLETYFARQNRHPHNCGYGQGFTHLHAIGALDEDGLLAPGIHHADWDDFASRFAGGERRQLLIGGLLAVIELLKQVGAECIDVGGSFVTAKPEPGDIDAGGPAWPQCALSSTMLTARDHFLRLYFGVDLGVPDTLLHNRTLVDWEKGADEVFSEMLSNYRPLSFREVGVVRIDITKPVPPAKQFVPFAAFPGEKIPTHLADDFRQRAPQHWYSRDAQNSSK